MGLVDGPIATSSPHLHSIIGLYIQLIMMTDALTDTNCCDMPSRHGWTTRRQLHAQTHKQCSLRLHSCCILHHVDGIKYPALVVFCILYQRLLQRSWCHYANGIDVGCCFQTEVKVMVCEAWTCSLSSKPQTTGNQRQAEVAFESLLLPEMSVDHH